MRQDIATAMALALVVGVLGLSIVPTVAAVSADCNDDFDIADSEQDANTRTLPGNGDEVGVEDATAIGGDENVTVRLLSNDAHLKFGIFELDNQTCERSKTVSMNCEDDVDLDTTPSTVSPPVEETCTIEAPSLGDKDYYFHVVNQQASPLDYEIFVSS